ncbi:MAG: LPXTG cell wall anchor domain-containing protein [Prevotella sp.]|nr:LPXTG cell wall anchor domain-containing protein [Prevotella sp.]
MFGFGKGETIIMEYSCRPRHEGMMYVLFSLFMMLYGVIRVLTSDESYYPLLIFGALSLVLLAVGIWILKFRKKDFRRIVYLNTWVHHLYLKSIWLLAVVYTVASAALITLLQIVIKLLSGDDHLTFQSIMETLWHRGEILIILLYAEVREIAGYYFYYISPEDSRKQL